MIVKFYSTGPWSQFADFLVFNGRSFLAQPSYQSTQDFITWGRKYKLGAMTFSTMTLCLTKLRTMEQHASSNVSSCWNTKLRDIWW
jgi:hypothetical protein